MKRLAWKAQERARHNGNGSPLVWFKVGSWALKGLWTRIRLRVAEGWLNLNAHLTSEAKYSHNGHSLRFKITSSVELKRVQNKGQPFILEEFLGRLIEGGVYYDVGANIGIFALPAAKIVGEDGLVVAFEPEAANYHRLLENADRNGLNNVLAFNIGLGAANASSLLYRPTDRLGEGGHSLYKPRRHRGGTSRILLARLDGLISFWSLPPPNYMKIDVEGAEVEVLRGMPDTLASDDLQALVCEVRIPGAMPEYYEPTDEAVTRLLTEHGFVETARCATGGAGNQDVLFLKAGK